MNSELFQIRTCTGTLIFNMVDDNVQEIMEDQNSQIMASNQMLGVASKVEIF